MQDRDRITFALPSYYLLQGTSIDRSGARNVLVLGLLRRSREARGGQLVVLGRPPRSRLTL